MIFVVVANLGNDGTGVCFHGMQFVVLLLVVLVAGGDTSEPIPGLSVVGRLTDADTSLVAPEILAYIELAAVRKLNGAVGTVDQRVITAGPGHALVG